VTLWNRFTGCKWYGFMAGKKVEKRGGLYCVQGVVRVLHTQMVFYVINFRFAPVSHRILNPLLKSIKSASMISAPWMSLESKYSLFFSWSHDYFYCLDAISWVKKSFQRHSKRFKNKDYFFAWKWFRDDIATSLILILKCLFKTTMIRIWNVQGSFFHSC